MGKKYLSDVIDYERDIEPYRVIQIYSGVGSGKNVWVKQLIKQGKSVLLITSRKTTADAQADALEGIRYIDIDTLAETGADNNRGRNVVVTNAGIEQYLKKKYDPENVKTHIWNYFDLIILDEAHSIVSDALFADSTFHVTWFLSYIIHNTDKKVIFMSGTPEPIQGFFTDKVKEGGEYTFLDFYDECVHVDPENVVLYYISGIEYEIRDYMNGGYRSIYFANSISRMEELVKRLVEIGVPEEVISVSYSGDEDRDFPPTILKNRNDTEKSLITSDLIPDNIKIFLTTSRNKEGVNIKNDDIKLMFAESTDRASLIQMAGRVRKRLEFFVILYDAKQHKPSFSAEEIELGWYCKSGINSFWKNSEFKTNEQKTISMIERKFPGIRYDYLSDKFREHVGKEIMYDQNTNDLAYLDGCRELVMNGGTYYVYNNHEYDLVTPEKMLRKWFPYSDIQITIEASPAVQTEAFNQKLRKYIKDNGYLEKQFTKEEKENFLNELNCMLDVNKRYFDYQQLNLNTSYKQLAPILKRINYEMRQVSHKKDSLYRLEKIQ